MLQNQTPPQSSLRDSDSAAAATQNNTPVRSMHLLGCVGMGAAAMMGRLLVLLGPVQHTGQSLLLPVLDSIVRAGSTRHFVCCPRVRTMVQQRLSRLHMAIGACNHEGRAAMAVGLVAQLGQNLAAVVIWVALGPAPAGV